MAVATAAKDSGYRSFGGVLIRSRARLISSTTATARSAAALKALSRGLVPSRATSASGDFGPLPFFLSFEASLFSPPWYTVKAYAPRSAPSATASASSTDATGSAKPAFFEPASARAAEPHGAAQGLRVERRVLLRDRTEPGPR